MLTMSLYEMNILFRKFARLTVQPYYMSKLRTYFRIMLINQCSPQLIICTYSKLELPRENK